MTVEYSVVSIGTLSCNRLWGEGAAVRTAHATTTLISTKYRTILVDPSLPAAALAARFDERTGKSLQDVTDVFCTTLRPVHRRSLEALAHANWWCSEEELEVYSDFLRRQQDTADRQESEDAGVIKAELKLLDRFKPAPDKFDDQVSLYPLPGASEGSAGLLLTPPTVTIVIAGDAALTAEHVSRGQVWHRSADPAAAVQSMQDLLEIADVIIPGHDNLMLAPRRWL